MGAMGSKLRMTMAASGYTARGIVHWCPACKEVHQFAIDTPNSTGAKWQWNGNVEAPTFTPSMLIRWGKYAPHIRLPYEDSGICHYTLTAGVINYCSDSTHVMAGKSIQLPDWPYAPGSYGGIED